MTFDIVRCLWLNGFIASVILGCHIFYRYVDCRSGECSYAKCHGAVLKPCHLVGAGHVGEPLEVHLARLACLLLEPGLKVGHESNPKAWRHVF